MRKFAVSRILVGLFLCCVNSALAHDKYGVVDLQNKFVIPPIYEHIQKAGSDSFNCYIKWDENDLRGAQFQITELRDKDGHLVKSNPLIKMNSPWNARPPFRVSYEGYKLVPGATESAPRELLYRTRLVCKFPASYDVFEILDEAHFLARTNWYKPGVATPPPLVLDRSGNVVAAMPAGVSFVSLNDTGFICQKKSLSSAENWTKGLKIYFVDNGGNIRSTIRCADYSHFENKLSIAKLNRNNYGFEVDMFLNTHMYEGIISQDGKWLIKPEFAGFEIAGPDRLIKEVYQQHFDSNECKTKDGSLGRQFDMLLDDYELIGMPVEKLEALIGTRNARQDKGVITYTIGGFGTHCGNAYSFVQFKLADKKVIAWRFYSTNDREQKWIDKNITGADRLKEAQELRRQARDRHAHLRAS